MKHEVRRIDAASAARLAGLVAGLLALLADLSLLLLAWTALARHPQVAQAAQLGLMPMLLKAAGIGLVAYVAVAIGGLLYNLLAGHFGGVLLEVDVRPDQRAASIASSSTSKISVASGGMTGGAPRLP